MKTGVLLINLGTPDSPSTKDVSVYLREFLMDRRVIDIPFLNRFFLINFIIAPFRAPKSAKIYKEVWEERGSPLLFHGMDCKELLQKELGKEFVVEFGMRYQNPGLAPALQRLKDQHVTRIILIPLYPQYASASTGSSIEACLEIIKTWETIPEIKTISSFCDHPDFIHAFAAIGKKYMEKTNWDHIIFSYHGVPERQIMKASCGDQCKLGTCCQAFHDRNRLCYRAQCFETTRLLVEKLQIPKDTYSIGFQSRLGKTPWIKPYTDVLISELAKKGHKKILFFSPSFIADCLETTIEGGVEYKELFEQGGGEEWQLVESLNSHPEWITCLRNIVLENTRAV